MSHSPLKNIPSVNLQIVDFWQMGHFSIASVNRQFNWPIYAEFWSPIVIKEIKDHEKFQEILSFILKS